jgi:hypothetical protein
MDEQAIAAEEAQFDLIHIEINRTTCGATSIQWDDLHINLVNACTVDDIFMRFFIASHNL